MNVVIVSSLAIPATRGDAVVVEQTARALAALGHNVTLVCNRQGRHPIELEERVLLVGTGALSPAVGMVTRIRQLVPLLLGCSIDVVHAIELFPFDEGGALLSRLLKVPFIFDFGVEPLTTYRASAGVLKGQPTISRRIALALAGSTAGPWFYRGLFRLASGVVAVSSTLKRSLVSLYWLDPQKVIVAPCGAREPATEPPDPTDRAAAPPVFVHMSSLRPFHGAEVFVGAMPRVLRRIPDASFLVIGANDQDPVNQTTCSRIRTAARRLECDGHLTILPWLPPRQLSQLLHTAHVGVDSRIPSEATPYGFSPLKDFDYLAHGLVVVASRCPETEEFLDDRVCLFVPPADPEALADRLCEAVSLSPSKRLSRVRAGYQLVSERYSWRRRAEILEQFYRTLKQGGEVQ